MAFFRQRIAVHRHGSVRVTLCACTRLVSFTSINGTTRTATAATSATMPSSISYYDRAYHSRHATKDRCRTPLPDAARYSCPNPNPNPNPNPKPTVTANPDPDVSLTPTPPSQTYLKPNPAPRP